MRSKHSRWFTLALVALLLGSVLWPSFAAGMAGQSPGPSIAASADDGLLTETLTATLTESETETATQTPTDTSDKPDVPASPADPDPPEKPASPGTPGTPQGPGTPQQPDAPGTPETPGTPSDPAQGASNGTPANGTPGNGTPPSGPVSPHDSSNDTTQVNVSVRNVTPGEPVAVNLSLPANASNETSVVVRRMTVEPKDGDPFSLNVTTGDRPLSTTPAFDPGTGTLELGYIRVNHTIPDSDIGHVNFTFRVNRSTLNATRTAPDEVVLYRFANGSWSPVPTSVVTVTDGYVVLEARSPGLSDFLVGAQQPKFKIAKALVSARTITIGEDVAVRVRITNVGEADGSYTVTLKIDGRAVAERDVTVAANGTRQVTFTRTFRQAGTYKVLVNQEHAGEVDVSRGNLDTAAPMAATATPRPTQTTTRGPGFGTAISLSSLFAAAALLARRR